MAPAVRNLLETGGGGGLVIIEAGELRPRSTLRQTCETAQAVGAVACYLDEGEALRRSSTRTLGRHGLTGRRDAADLLAGASRRRPRPDPQRAGEAGPLSRASRARSRPRTCWRWSATPAPSRSTAIVLLPATATLRALDRGLQIGASTRACQAIPVLRAHGAAPAAAAAGPARRWPEVASARQAVGG